MTSTSTATPTHPTPTAGPSVPDLVRAIDRRSFCTLATTSSAHRSHVAGVLYAAVGTELYISTMRDSRKARNVAANPHVAVCIPVRRLPVGPPSSLQFQARGEVLDLDDPTIVGLADAGRIDSITGHGELELPGGCFLRIVPNGRVNTYGLGMSLRQLLRDPLNSAGVVELAPAAAGRA